MSALESCESESSPQIVGTATVNKEYTSSNGVSAVPKNSHKIVR
jgi:hypothetical protein